ncbi:sensor histidine kinase [Parafilimonas terrae]|uniref:histidine kinase n=1 Tax=Parafilimonas terrae TaxID=1465490 RepID=A0A1I5SIN3_9BACT|nr:HAMP domain-containing sensor histidine kinase [Parafilimonas terrae]SFP70630.1 Histidine kinase-, DNA gyrase B-, and HSP90-like ATPase [Parafilimonas terrae]
MIQQWLNGKTLLFLIAAAIVTGTIFYSSYLAKKIAADEKKKVEIWVEAQHTILNVTDEVNLNLAARISSENTEIPIIETNENDSINAGNCVNLNSAKIKSDPNYLKKKLVEFKKDHEPIIITLSEKPYKANKYYYGQSVLQKEVRYYPVVQLIIVGLFLIVIIIAQHTSYRSTQNQVWAGMAKETAHQLGTPVSSLKGWVEVLKETPGTEKFSAEIEKDINRLELITDRFGKIGSHPHLEEKNIVEQVSNMMDYIKRRAGGKVNMSLNAGGEKDIPAMISPPLFDWVIENLLKNALDAIEGKGSVEVYIKDTVSQVLIDVTDTGKGISKNNIAKVFNPGFTTKKRGWGLGLTLSKRIIEQYHKGALFVKHSEPGKGTTFRIELNK